jgi:inorganic pyrophosphatase
MRGFRKRKGVEDSVREGLFEAVSTCQSSWCLGKGEEETGKHQTLKNALPYDLAKLPAFHGRSRFVNIVVDTPKASPYKLKYEAETGIFRLHKALPLGMVFPFNFGFVPCTLGGDGDALDVLIISDYVMPNGPVVLGQLISVLEATQHQGDHTQRNDRLIAIPIGLASRKPMQPVVEFNSALKKAIADFFAKYNELQGRTFRLIRFSEPLQANRVVRRNLSPKGRA